MKDKIKEKENEPIKHVDYAVAENCQNLEESYGEICVKCGKCGRQFELRKNYFGLVLKELNSTN